MDLLNDKAKEIINNIILSTLPKINVISGTCRYNFRCQHNAVHDAINEKHDKIAMCFYLDKDDNCPIIHFINVNANNTIFIDNTLGNWSSQYDYYLIKYIDKDSFFKVNTIFTEYRKELQNKLPFIVRLLSNLEF